MVNIPVRITSRTQRLKLLKHNTGVEGDRVVGTRENRGGRWAGSGRRRSGMPESYEGGRRGEK